MTILRGGGSLDRPRTSRRPPEGRDAGLPSPSLPSHDPERRRGLLFAADVPHRVMIFGESKPWCDLALVRREARPRPRISRDGLAPSTTLVHVMSFTRIHREASRGRREGYAGEGRGKRDRRAERPGEAHRRRVAMWVRRPRNTSRALPRKNSVHAFRGRAWWCSKMPGRAVGQEQGRAVVRGCRSQKPRGQRGATLGAVEGSKDEPE